MMMNNKIYTIIIIFSLLLILNEFNNESKTKTIAAIVCEEETPINRLRTKFLVQYILEGDIIMINECECSSMDKCDDKNSIELVKYRCRGNYSICCVNQMTKRANEIESK